MLLPDGVGTEYPSIPVTVSFPGVVADADTFPERLVQVGLVAPAFSIAN